MTTAECLEAAARLESLAQSLYTLLADRFVDRPDLHQMFIQLAKEEEQHAQRIRALSRHGRRVKLEPTRREAVVRSLVETESFLSALTQTADQGIDAEELYRSVVEFETRFASIHAEQLGRPDVPWMKYLFSSLAEQDRRHAVMVRQAMQA